jgi:hypothetical protein
MINTNTRVVVTFVPRIKGVKEHSNVLSVAHALQWAEAELWDKKEHFNQLTCNDGYLEFAEMDGLRLIPVTEEDGNCVGFDRYK